MLTAAAFVVLSLGSQTASIGWVSLVAALSSDTMSANIGVFAVVQIVLVGMASIVGGLLARLARANLMVRVAMDIQALVQDKYLTLGADFHEKHGRGELLQIAIQGATAAATFAIETLTGPLIAIGSCALGVALLYRQLAAVGSNAMLMVMLGATLVALPLVADVLSQKLQAVFASVRRGQAGVLEHVSQSLMDPIGLMLANVGDRRVESFRRHLDELAPTQLHASGLAGIANELPRITSLLIQLVVLAIVVFTGESNDRATVVASAMAAMMIAPQVASNVSSLAGSIMAARQLWPEVEHVMRVLELRPKIPEPTSTTPVRLPRGADVQFENVSFRYEGSSTNVVDGIDLTCTAGTTTAIIGASGSGKSTVLRLIGRVHDVTSGRIVIAGAEIRTLPWSALRSFDSVSRCAQEPVFLPISVRENFRLFIPDITDERIEEVCRSVDVWAALVDASPNDPLDLRVANTQAEGALSGGQRKRLELARALAGSPSMLVLDEPTSGISVSDKLLMIPTLRRATQGTTCILVDHDLRFVAAVAEFVAILDSGRVAEFGRVAELRARPDSRLAQLLADGLTETHEGDSASDARAVGVSP